MDFFDVPWWLPASRDYNGVHDLPAIALLNLDPACRGPNYCRRVRTDHNLPNRLLDSHLQLTRGHIEVRSNRGNANLGRLDWLGHCRHGQRHMCSRRWSNLGDLCLGDRREYGQQNASRREGGEPSLKLHGAPSCERSALQSIWWKNCQATAIHNRSKKIRAAAAFVKRNNNSMLTCPVDDWHTHLPSVRESRAEGLPSPETIHNDFRTVRVGTRVVQ